MSDIIEEIKKPENKATKAVKAVSFARRPSQFCEQNVEKTLQRPTIIMECTPCCSDKLKQCIALTLRFDDVQQLLCTTGEKKKRNLD